MVATSTEDEDMGASLVIRLPLLRKLTSSRVTVGLVLASGASQRKIPYRLPMPSWRALIVNGKPDAPPAALRASLFVML
jgi:hypothetical protein